MAHFNDWFAVQVSTSGGGGDGEGPAWAPLRDNYMLTTSKLKDWDKAAVRKFSHLLKITEIPLKQLHYKNYLRMY